LSLDDYVAITAKKSLWWTLSRGSGLDGLNVIVTGDRNTRAPAANRPTETHELAVASR
jgi:hypothetical protein